MEREPEGTLGHEIKNLTKSEVLDVIDSFNFKTVPREHQSRALYLGLDQDTWLYALDMGLGKTLVGLYLSEMFQSFQNEKLKVLVTCPPVVMRQWNKEVEKHSILDVLIVDPKIRTKEKKLDLLDSSMTNITVVSHPWLVSLFNWAAKDKNIYSRLHRIFLRFDVLIVDEAHILRNPLTKGFTGYREYLLQIPKRYLLTGTPTGNTYTGVWGLYYMLDKGETFGKNYQTFLIKYFNSFSTGRYTKYTLKSEKRKEFMRLFWTKVIRWEETECNDLPGKTFTTIPVEMSAEQTTAYDNLLCSTSRIGQELEEDPEFKLMKVTAGIGIKDSPKLEVVKNLVDSVCIERNKQFLVWCWLRDESDYILENLRKNFKSLRIEAIKGGIDQNQREEVLNSWAKGKVDVLIANQSSLGVGIDLYEASSCCFFSNNRSLIDRKQSEKRIHRTGQTNHCNYYDIVCEQTIDEINLSIVQKAKTSFIALTKDHDIIGLLRKQRGK